MRRDLDMVDKLVNKIDKQIKGMFMPSKKDFYNRGQKQPKVLFPAALDESDESETGEFIIRQDLDNDEWWKLKLLLSRPFCLFTFTLYCLNYEIERIGLDRLTHLNS